MSNLSISDGIKYFTWALLFMANLDNSIYCQSIIVKKTYYDIYQTKLKAEWQQTANGYTNGYYKQYHENGKLYIDKIIKTEDVYPYLGIELKWKEFDQAGNLFWSIAQNDKREFQGEQLSYAYSGPKLYLRSKAIFDKGKLLAFEINRDNGTKLLDFKSNSYFKTFNSEGQILNNVSINASGQFSGTLYQDNNEIIIEVLEGKIQKVYEKEPKPKNGNWSVYRIGRDTLVSSAKINDKSYFKKYYIDTVIIKLKDRPTINIDYSQYEKATFGLDILDDIFYSDILSEKYDYKFKFYNRKYQEFIYEETRSINDDALLSTFDPIGAIKTNYKPTGEIKNKIVTSPNGWQEFDSNGILINSSDIEAKKEQEKLEQEKLEQERIEKENRLEQSRISELYDLSQQIERKQNEVVNLYIGFGISKKKKILFDAYDKYQKRLNQSINLSLNTAEKIKHSTELLYLYNKMIFLSSQDTKSIEKKLKDITDTNEIKLIFDSVNNF